MKRMNLTATALLLAIGLVAPIWADESSSETTFSLHLEGILATEELVEATPEVEPSASKVVSLATLPLAVNAAAFNNSVAAAEAAAQESSTPQRRGIGRWMKKYWYIPVIVASSLRSKPRALESRSQSPAG